MFLIEYNDGYFINANEINGIWFNKEDIHFQVKGDNESSYKVAEKFRFTFLNNMDAINGNFSIHARYNEINKVT